MSRQFLLFVFLLFLVAACGEPPAEVPPSDVLDRSKFTDVMVDVQLIEGMKIHKLGPKRAKSPDMEAMYANIFQKHEVDKESFEKTYDYYKARPDEMELIYEQVLDSLSKLDTEVKKIYNTPGDRRDTLNRDSIQNARRNFKPL
jgi:hypothetical protein